VRTAAPSLALVAALAVVACGGQSPPPGEPDGLGGSAVESSGGISYGGTSGVAGGSIGIGGGSASIGKAGPVCAPDDSPPACLGIRPDMPCALEGVTCGSLICGLADTGSRSCTCATEWTCDECDYTQSPFRAPPPTLFACPPEVMDDVPCSEAQIACGPLPNGEVCVCFWEPTCASGLSWDCGPPPPGWNL